MSTSVSTPARDAPVRAPRRLWGPTTVRARLMYGYVLLGTAITALGLVGARTIYAQSEARMARRASVVHEIKAVAANGSAAAEESFSYMLVGDREERDYAQARFDEVCAEARQLESDLAGVGVVSKLARGVRFDACELGAAAERMFASYEADSRASHATYTDFEYAENALVKHVAGLDAELDFDAENDRTATKRRTDALLVLLGSIAVVVATAAARKLADSVAAPLHELREALRSFGGGNLDATVEIQSSDELGELACAFREMAGDMKSHVRALDAARDRLSDIFASMEELLVVCDVEGTICAVNRACVDLSGYLESELVGLHASELFTDVPIAAEGAVVDRTAADGTAGDVAADDGARPSGESMLRSRDERFIPVRISASRLRDGSRGGYVLVAENLTERQRLELELRQAQKMEAIGRLAGGVAHDFNNMLSIILGYTEVLLDGLGPSDPTFEPLTEVRTAGQRSAELTQQLLAFSRRQTLEAVVVDVNDVLESTVRMMRRTLGSAIAISVDPCLVTCPVRTEAGQLENVLMNLLINARDAMPRGGQLSVSSARVDIDEHHPDRRLGLCAGPHVRLQVSDSGVGMDRETMSRVFEPFFTTKAQGEGTGLGLATVFGIVQRSGGGIGVESEVGRGTTFRLYFPLVADVAVSGVILVDQLRGVA